MMTSIGMYYIGIGFTAVNMILTWWKGDLKPDLGAIPFMLFAGAATGHYLGL